MNETMMREKVHQAVDAHCAHLKENPYLAQRVLAAAKEPEARRGRKLPVAVVVALVLVLLTATATAAVLLSMRQLVEDTAIPLAQESEGDRYSLEETSLLVRLAEENGIVLSDNAKAHIAKAAEQDEGYWKEELLMAMAKAEFGDSPLNWTLEQQKWFDDVCVAIGFIDEPSVGMPENPDEARAAVIEAASAYLRAAYGAGDELLDADSYTIGVQYLNGKADDVYDGMYWSIQFEPQGLTLSEYWVYLNDDLEVWWDVRRLGAVEGASFDETRSRYEHVYGGAMWFWTQEQLQSFRDAMNDCKPQTGSGFYIRMMEVSYPSESEAAVSREQAIALGAAAAGLDESGLFSALYVRAGDVAVWHMCFNRFDGDYLVDIDGLTGEVVYAGAQENFNLSSLMVPYFIFETVEPWEPSFG